MEALREPPFQIRTRTLYLAGALCGLVLASIPRIMASAGDLWLDEIWSLYLIRGVKHFWDILMIRHDNNHVLNSIYLHILGAPQPGFAYRLFSVGAGAASCVLMGFINLRHGFAAGLITFILGMFSYPLIHYSSEARGYAPAMFFSLAAFFCLRETLARDSRGMTALFWTSSLLGLLSHPTFLYVYASLVIWSILRLKALGLGKRALIGKAMRFHAFPMAAIGVFYFSFLRSMTVGGGDPQALSDLMASLAVLISGAPEGRIPETLAILLVSTGLAAGLFHLVRQGSDESLFFPLVLIVAPFGFWLAIRPGFVYERYFLLCIPFYFLMAGRLLAAGFGRSRAWAAAGAGLLILFLLGNLLRTADLLTTGRGKYREALTYLAEQTKGNEILVGSDHDFRNKMVLLYYSQYLPVEKRLIYFNQSEWPSGGPEWIFTHSQRADFVPQREIVLANRGTFTLEKHYPYKGLSGWHWALYRRKPQAAD